MEQDEKSEKPRRKPKSDAAIGGMVATFALLFLAVSLGFLFGLPLDPRPVCDLSYPDSLKWLYYFGPGG